MPLHCEGFKSRHWSSGWDVIEHGILRRLVPDRGHEKRDDLLNVIHLGGPDVFSPLVTPLGLKVNLVMGGNSLERLADLSTAAATVTMCFVLSYLATGLEQEYGVPEIRAPLPYGLDATDAWLRDIARVTKREDRVEAVIASKRARIAPELRAAAKSARREREGFVAAGAAFAHCLIADLRELGVTVDDAFSFHHDPSTDSRDPQQDLLGALVQEDRRHRALHGKPGPAFPGACRAEAGQARFRHRPLLGLDGHPRRTNGHSRAADLLLERRPWLPGAHHHRARHPAAPPRRRFYEDVAAHSRFPYQQWWLDETNPYALAADDAA